MGDFFKRAFQDMKDSAKAQHQVDQANLEAVKTESKAQWEEMKAMSRPEVHKAKMQAERDAQLAAARERTAAAQSRIDAVQDKKTKP